MARLTAWPPPNASDARRATHDRSLTFSATAAAMADCDRVPGRRRTPSVPSRPSRPSHYVRALLCLSIGAGCTARECTESDVLLDNRRLKTNGALASGLTRPRSSVPMRLATKGKWSWRPGRASFGRGPQSQHGAHLARVVSLSGHRSHRSSPYTNTEYNARTHATPHHAAPYKIKPWQGSRSRESSECHFRRARFPLTPRALHT